jgi:hypothetical protein
VVGKTESCACPGTEVQGAQTCLPSGAYGPCEGCPGGAGGAGGAGVGGGGVGGSAGGSAGAGGAASPCSSCVQDKCKSQLETCQADPNCDEISKCVLEQCLESTTQGELLQCAFSQCGASINDQSLLPVAQCAGQECAEGVCPFATGSGGSGGSTNFDPGVEAGVVTCGPSLGCDVEKDGACCISVAGLSGPEYSCKKGPCTGGFISIPQPCDGPEDCEGGQVCCGSASQQGGGVSCVSECKPPPNGQAYTLCHKDEDCGAGDSCQVCDVGQFGISIVFRVCGSECPSAGGPGGPGGP